MAGDLSERRLERRLDSQPDEVDDIGENMVNMTSSPSGESYNPKSPVKNKHQWSAIEDAALIEALMQLNNAGDLRNKNEKGFRPGHGQSYNKCLRAFPAWSNAREWFYSLCKHVMEQDCPIVVRSGPSGGGFGGSDGGSRGGGGDGGENGDSGEKNRAEALLVLAEADRTLESLPKDLSAAIENGRVPGLIVQRFFELEKSPVFRWLLQFGGLKERLLGDDLFLTKVAIECGVGIFTKVLPSTPCLMVVLPKRSLRDGGGHFCLLLQRILSTLIEALTKQL
ncbi:hypothetical protein ZIOFF_063622 [Zingiber officinale]|uniref:Uncharacterized protein n=1 Tax=Zingiber officinale TaxID=94328 RepID=A0A8J5F6B2_ZINOF|nr:hypothetical protein ZIOFF_063622 [Zingiber officinale]